MSEKPIQTAGKQPVWLTVALWCTLAFGCGAGYVLAKSAVQKSPQYSQRGPASAPTTVPVSAPANTVDPLHPAGHYDRYGVQGYTALHPPENVIFVGY